MIYFSNMRQSVKLFLYLKTILTKKYKFNQVWLLNIFQNNLLMKTKWGNSSVVFVFIITILIIITITTMQLQIN